MKPKKIDSGVEITQLIEQHKAIIYKVVDGYCSDAYEQEYLIQEIMFQLIRSYKKFNHQVKVTTWIYKVTLNVSISDYRKIKNRQKYFLPMPEKLVVIDDSTEKTPDENLIRLRAFIKELSPLNRAILIMYLDKNSHAEIAGAMGITVSNVGTKIGRIKKQLKKKFNQ